jgi:hypothetical protein
MDSDNNINIVRGDSVNKTIKLGKNGNNGNKSNNGNNTNKNNITIIRDESDSSDSDSSSVSVSTTSTINNNKNIQNIQNIQNIPKKTKIVKKNKVPKINFEEYASFSNPKKVRVREDSESGSESEYSSISGSEYSDYYSEKSDGPTYAEKQKMKQDLLIKIQALEKKGYEFTKKFTMTSDYSEMEFEYLKVKHFIESQGAIRFSRRCLMACVTGIEFLNKKFDPFSVKLEGWSENVMENIDDYDNIFEKLHEKYSKKAEIAPEIELILTLGGSAFMFHLTNSLLKTPTFEGITKIGENVPNKGNFMAGMMGAMSQGMKEMNNQRTPFPEVYTPSPQQGIPKSVDTRGPRKEMKGPSIDASLFGNVNNYPMPPGPVDYPLPDDDRFSVASSSDSSEDTYYNNKNNKVLISSNQNTKNETIPKKIIGKSKGGIELNIT